MTTTQIVFILITAVGLAASIIQIISFIRNRRKKDIWILILILAFSFSAAFYYQKNNIKEQEKAIVQLKEQYENENMLKDAEVTYNSIEIYGYQYFSFALADLSKIVGFYSRHLEIYKQEYESFKKHEDSFTKLHTEKIKNGEYFSSSEINEIYSIVKAGRNNLASIIGKQKNNYP